MKKVIINIDNDTEMLEIKYKEDTLFYGNFWDFDRPEGIIELLENLNIKVEVNDEWESEENDYED